MLEPLPSFNKPIIPSNSTIIIGLSGGPDSIYLLHRLYRLQKELNVTLIAAHLDHEWQESSKIAVQLCKEICAQLQITFITKKFSELNFCPIWNGSQEEIGRNGRRFFFENLAHAYQASGIALAHHAQDQQETFFIRLIRGASLTGLTCMRSVDGIYLRPILTSSKKQILEYLAFHNLDFYTDPTNASDNYLRNKIRNHLLPTFEKIDTRSLQKITTTIDHLQDVENFIEQETIKTLHSIQNEDGIQLQAFLELHNILQYRILLQLLITKQISFTPSKALFDEIIRFLRTSRKKEHCIYQQIIIEKNKNLFFCKIFKKN
ncbi:MAG: tRNA lysidine(34) synthetase TilS [Candidatus Chromulinivorax sp.]